MRGGEEARGGTHRVVGGQRFDVEDVDAGPGDPALVQGGQKSRLVDDGRPRGVDQLRGRLEEGELGGSEQARVRSLSARWTETKSLLARRSSRDGVSSAPTSSVGAGTLVDRVE